MNKPTVYLIGQDGNVFFIIGQCSKALRRAKLIQEAAEFTAKCFAAGSYDEVLRLAMDYCDVQ
jgi:hypothetical protein